MEKLKAFCDKNPITAFVVLCFGITWAVWFSVPYFAGSDWALGRIYVGAGFGPAIAAIILSQLKGQNTHIVASHWWMWFISTFLLLAVLYSSILMTGDAINATEFAVAIAPGLSLVGIVGVLISSTVAASIIAFLACSGSIQLNSLLKWRVPMRWWIIAILLPAGWMLSGLAVSLYSGGDIVPVTGGLETLQWSLYVIRSLLLTFLVVAIGEEAGWRAWLLPELQKRFTPLLSTFFLGILWGLWHFPLFVIGQYADAPEMVFAKAGVCVMLGVIFTWFYNRTNGNLLLMVMLHTAMNNTPRFVPFSEQMGLFLFGVIILMIFTDRMWQKRLDASV